MTRILEAYAEEPVRVLKLSQSIVSYDARATDLGVAAGERLLRRVVVLRGGVTGRPFIHADAVLVLDRLPPTVRDGLVSTDKPIGRLLAEARVETFREMLESGRVEAQEWSAHFEIPATADLLYRTYRIVTGHRPAMLITERFPAEGPW
jgi:chorismate-pyruvate lyase